jgi:hypothetical protein
MIDNFTTYTALNKLNHSNSQSVFELNLSTCTQFQVSLSKVHVLDADFEFLDVLKA